ncbi:MAG TPA: hypothetical protein VE243_00010 [Candidatus Acidoferrum sp.]|nr:hypothetical protein [Candidatus Acidoferrum sp.]
MPSREILECRIHRHACRLLSEIDGHQCGDIRDREAIAREERLVADLRVEPLQLLFDSFALGLAVLGKLLDAGFEQFVWKLSLNESASVRSLALHLSRRHRCAAYANLSSDKERLGCAPSRLSIALP